MTVPTVRFEVRPERPEYVDNPRPGMAEARDSSPRPAGGVVGGPPVPQPQPLHVVGDFGWFGWFGSARPGVVG